MLNNPIGLNDPTGHTSCSGTNWDDGPSCFTDANIDTNLKGFGVTTSGMDLKHKLAILQGVHDVGDNLVRHNKGGSAESAFRNVFKGGVTIKWDPSCKGCRSDDAVKKGTNKLCGTDYSSPGCKPGGGVTSWSGQTITFASMSGESTNIFSRMVDNVVHELGHSYYHNIGNPKISEGFSRDALIPNSCGACYELQQHPPSMNVGGQDIPTELVADAFVAWTYDAWNTLPANANAVTDAQKAMNDLGH